MEAIDETEESSSEEDETLGLWLTADDQKAAEESDDSDLCRNLTKTQSLSSTFNKFNNSNNCTINRIGSPDGIETRSLCFSKGKSKSAARKSAIISTVLMGLIVFGLFLISSSWSSLQSSNKQVTELVSIREQSGKQVNTFEESIRNLLQDLSFIDASHVTKETGAITNKTGNVGVSFGSAPTINDPVMVEEVTLLQGKVKALSEKANILKEHVQEMSKREAIQKYGSNVHRVKIELAFPDQLKGPDYFVIELAPMELMPHSVHFFLEMVSTGLLDGCSFILNALHVLKVAPLPYDGSSAAEKARAFTKNGLESVAFKEYSESFPHKQYTVGFAADGSPSFYINTEDNDEVHVGDPCFGKIVEGIDTVKRLENCPTKNGIWFERRIGIKSATLLSDEPDKNQFHHAHDEN